MGRTKTPGGVGMAAENIEQAIWNVLRERKTATLNDIWAEVNVDAPECEPFASVREVGSYLHGLCRAGYCAKDKNFKETHLYIGRKLHLAMAPKAKHPEDPTQTHPELQAMWNTMRRLPAFTATDVEVHAATPKVNITGKRVRNYIGMLHKAGYLREVEKAVKGKRAARYRMIDETGPKAPIPRRQPQLFDPNKNAVRYLDGVVK